MPTKHFRGIYTHATCCGILDVGGFLSTNGAFQPGRPIKDIPPSGTGFFTCGFSEDQREVKEEMDTLFDLQWDTGWTYNNNSRGMMIFCVYQHRGWEQEEPDEHMDEDND